MGKRPEKQKQVKLREDGATLELSPTCHSLKSAESAELKEMLPNSGKATGWGGGLWMVSKEGFTREN